MLRCVSKEEGKSQKSVIEVMCNANVHMFENKLLTFNKINLRIKKIQDDFQLNLNQAI